jgi:hypothetical protein
LTVLAAVTVRLEERRGSGFLARDQEVELSEEGKNHLQIVYDQLAHLFRHVAVDDLG